MKKKTFIILCVIALLLPLLTLTTFAADDIDNTGMLDGIGGFFRDIGNGLVDGFNKSIQNIKNGISHIADGISRIISVIGNGISHVVDSISRAIQSLLKGLRDLFVPSGNYFSRVQTRLQDAINGKLGGVLSVTEYLKNRFALLSAPADLDHLYILEFPQGHIFGGTRIDMLMRLRGQLPLFRGLLSFMSCVLPTIIFSYRRIKSMIKT